MSEINSALLANAQVFEAELGRRRLREFIKLAWHVLEPANPLIPNWHIDCVADHLTAVTNGQIQRLIISVPPGHSKSMMVSVFWPAWEWISHPSTRWLFASYKEDLAIRDSVKCRDLIQSPWYSARYGSIYKINSDQNQKRLFSNSATGSRLAIGISSGTGDRADRICLDDPNSMQDIESDLERQAVNDAYDSVFSQRGSDAQKSTFVLIQQRLHHQDLTGHLLEIGGFEHLCLPSEYEGGHILTGIGWDDPRTEDGELLFPARFPAAELERLKNLPGLNYAGQHQQRPVPREGGTFKIDWFSHEYTELPKLRRVMLGTDSAFKTGVKNDFTAMARIGTDGVDYFIMDILEEKIEWHELLKAHRAREKGLSAFAIEDAASGQSLIQELRRTSPIPVRAIPVRGRSLASRAEGLTEIAQSGKLRLPTANLPWKKKFMDQFTQFPTAAHDDIVAAVVNAMEGLQGVSVRRSRQRPVHIGGGKPSGRPSVLARDLGISR